MSLHSKQLASSQVYVRSQEYQDGNRDRENRVSAPDGSVVAATATATTAARGGSTRTAGHSRRSGGGGFERRGDDGRGRRQSDGCRAFFYVKVHALKKIKIPTKRKKTPVQPQSVSGPLGLDGARQEKKKDNSPRWVRRACSSERKCEKGFPCQWYSYMKRSLGWLDVPRCSL